MRLNDAIRRTIGYYLLFICLGLDTAVLGPVLPSLAEQTHSRLGQMGFLFLAGSTGYTLGTLFGGRIFDRVRGHPVLAVAQLMTAGLIALVPNIPWLWMLLIILTCKGFAEGLINTGANTLMVWTHNAKVSPFMNGLHFFFVLGAFLAPLLVAQLISFPHGYQTVYWILAVFASAIGMSIFLLPSSPKLVHIHENMGTTYRTSLKPYYPLILAATLFLFFYVGAEIAFGGWIYTYAVSLGVVGIAGAAYLTSGFWLSFTIGRLLSIPLSLRIRPARMILIALIGCVSVLLIAIIIPSSFFVIWIMTLALGFCMAPIWPSGFTLAGQSLKLTARASGIILLGDSMGGMVLPSLVGQVIESTGPQSMVYLVFISLVGNFMAFLGMLRLRTEKK